MAAGRPPAPLASVPLPLMHRLILALTGFLFLAPVAARGQIATVAVDEENVRAAPRGAIVAKLQRGTTIRLGETRDSWRAATFEGWVWGASVRRSNRDGYNLIVSATGGENLRESPNGKVIGRLSEGTLLTEVDRDGRWVRVRRQAWIWGASVAEARAERAPAAQPQPTGEAAKATRTTPPAESRATASRETPPAEPRATATSAPARPVPAASSGEWSRVGPVGVSILAAPDRDTLATIRAMAPVEVLSREGNWVRIRVEGWAWAPSLEAPADTGAILRDVTPAALAASPDGFRGRILQWTVQFIALEHAEKIRTDFYEGEPFILARAPGDETGFVYIAVPPERIDQVRALAPLQRITVVARVRTGRSALMGAPVLDLLELR